MENNMTEGFTVSEDDLLDRDATMAHPLVAALREAGIEVQPAHFGYNQNLFTGIEFQRGIMKFTIAITKENHLYLKMLERIGGPHGLRPTWLDLAWFADFCKARPELGIHWLLGKIKPYDNIPYHSSQESLRKLYCEFANCVHIGFDGHLEWVGLAIQDHFPPRILRQMRREGKIINHCLHP